MTRVPAPSPRQAWKTIAMVNRHSFANGTTILVKKGIAGGMNILLFPEAD